MCEIKDLFLKKGLLFVIDGWDEEMIWLVMDLEIVVMEERYRKGRCVFEKVGDFVFVWGMIGMFVGFVFMFKNLNDLYIFGLNMVIVLLMMLYGVLFVNLVFIFIVVKFEEKIESEIFIK